MEFMEFQKTLMAAFCTDEVKTSLRKMLAAESIAEDLEKYEAKVKELEEMLAKAEETTKEESEKYSTLLDEFNELSGTLAAEKIKADDDVKKANENLDAAKKELDAIKAELEKAKAESDEKSAKLESAEKSADDLKKQIEDLNKSIDDIKTQNALGSSDKDAKIAQMEKDAVDKDAQIARLTDLRTKLEAELTAKGDSISASAGEIDAIKKDLAAKDDEIIKVKAQLDIAKKMTSDVQSELDKVTAEKQAALNDAAEAKKLSAEFEPQMAAAKAEIADRDNKIATMNNQLQGMLVLRQKINEYAETANAYAEEVENARKILGERDNHIEQLESQINGFNSKIESLEQNVATKTNQVEEISKYAESIRGHAEKLELQVAERNKELSNKADEIAQLNKDIDAYKLTFGNLTSVFEEYTNLTPKTKSGLAEIFPADINVRSFLSSGAQWGHVQALWEYTQQKINNEDMSDVKTLSEIFAYFLDFHNSSYDAPLYAILDTKAGELYNEEFHSKIMTREERKAAFFDTKKKPTAPDAGPIKEVVLPGYKNLKNGRVMQPSLVRI